MKKNLLKLMALTFAVSMSLSFAGCGSKNAAGTSVPAETPEASTTESQTQESENKELTDTENSESASTESGNPEAGNQESEETGATKLEQWLAEPEAQQLAEESSDDTYSVELLSENGNILVLRYVYTEQLDLSDDSVKQAVLEYIDSALDSNSVIFTTMLEALRTEIGMDDLALRIEFVNADDSEIASKSFE